MANKLKGISRREFGIAAAGAGIVLAGAARAQTYPAKTITLMSSVIGGVPEAIQRAMVDRIRENTGAMLVFEPRGGGGGAPGLSALKRAEPDGHTFGITYASALTLNPLVTAGLDFDPVRDFAPISNLMSLGVVVVARPDYPAATLKELIEIGKARPETVRWGIAGAGNRTWLAMLGERTGAKFLPVPHRSSTDMVAATLGGHIDVHFDTVGTLVANMKEGRLKGLAFGGVRRADQLPDVPAVREIVPGLDMMSWFAALAPAGTPADRVAWLHRELVKALRDPKVADLVRSGGYDTVLNAPEEFGAAYRAEYEANKAIVTKYDIKG